MNRVPRLSLIVAMDQNRLIGREGGLPWRLPNDLKRFKALTLGQTVLMGRKTWVSLPRRPLPDRLNRVLTRNAGLDAPGAQVFQSLDAALAAPAQGDLFVIGGAALYALCLPLATRLELTVVETEAQGDTWFPPYALEDFDLVSSEAHPADERHAFAYRFLSLRRKPHAR